MFSLGLEPPLTLQGINYMYVHVCLHTHLMMLFAWKELSKEIFTYQQRKQLSPERTGESSVSKLKFSTWLIALAFLKTHTYVPTSIPMYIVTIVLIHTTLRHYVHIHTCICYVITVYAHSTMTPSSQCLIWRNTNPRAS